MNLNQITVSVKDVAQSITFYEALGLQLIVKALPHYARFECPTGDSTFSLHQSQNEVIGEGTWIYFEVENVDESVNIFIKKGIVFEALPEDKTWLWREARLKDLDSNPIIIYHAGENRKSPPWRI